ncbi:MAG: hypothetical protein FWH27_10585 [Planctomycetaceae bacterium]|nr:hypothetical protein [Planctomycetaceae bacterium]
MVLIHPASFLNAVAQENFVATGVEFNGYDAHVKAGNEFWDAFNANYGSIRTWQGHVDVTKKTWNSQEQKELLYHSEHGVDFHSDMINGRGRYISNATLGVSYRTGERVPFLLTREAVIRQKDLTPSFTYTAYTTHHYMDEVPEEERSKYISKLVIATNNNDFNMFFAPEMKGLPDAGLVGFRAIFDVFDLDKLEREYREEGKTEERIDVLLAPIRQNGFPKHWKLSQKDHFLYFDTVIGDHLTWDLSRGGWPILFKSGTHRWNCELQQVANIWVPKKITIEFESSDGSYNVEEMVWSDQKINEPIDEKLWDAPSLGVRRGDQGFDTRTDMTFTVEGDEYLPSLEQEEFETLLIDSNGRWTFLRYVAIIIGVCLIMAAVYMKFRSYRSS